MKGKGFKKVLSRALLLFVLSTVIVFSTTVTSDAQEWVSGRVTSPNKITIEIPQEGKNVGSFTIWFKSAYGGDIDLKDFKASPIPSGWPKGVTDSPIKGFGLSNGEGKEESWGFVVDSTADAGTYQFKLTFTYKAYRVPQDDGTRKDLTFANVDIYESPVTLELVKEKPSTTVKVESWTEWTFFFPLERWPPGVYWRRQWGIWVHDSSHWWNDVHFWFSSRPKINRGDTTGAPPKNERGGYYHYWAGMWWQRKLIEDEDGTGVAFEAPKHDPNWVFAPCEWVSFLVSSYYYDEGAPAAGVTTYELTLDGKPVGNTRYAVSATEVNTQIIDYGGYDSTNPPQNIIDVDMSTEAIVTAPTNRLVLDLGTYRGINHITVVSENTTDYSNPASMEVWVGSSDDGATFDQLLSVVSFPPARQGSIVRARLEPWLEYVYMHYRYFKLVVRDRWISENVKGNPVNASFAELQLQSPSGLTPVGSNVEVPLPGIGLTFSSVSSLGTTQITPTSTPPAGPPAGFTFLGGYFDVSTTATYTGPVTIAVPYDEILIQGDERNPRLFHWNGNNWEDVTVAVDTANNFMKGQVMSLSPFAIGAPSAPSSAPISIGYGIPWLIFTAISVIASCLYLFFRRRKRLVGDEVK